MVPLLSTLLFIVTRSVTMKLVQEASSSIDCRDFSEESKDPKDFTAKRVHFLFTDHFLSRIWSF